MYTAVASFPGSADYTAVQSSPLVFTIAPATPTVTVSDSGGPDIGAPYPATALVAGVVIGLDSTPAASLEGISPTVAYYSGSLDAQQVATANPLPDAPSDPGTYTVVASFQGSTDYVGASSAPLTFSIWPADAAATTTVLAWSPQAPIFGQTVTLTATVAVSPGPGPAPSSGVVDFENADTGVIVGAGQLVTGVASCPLTGLSIGMHHFLALYGGDGQNFTASTSDTISVLVIPAALPSPSVSVSDLGGTYNGSTYPATATVTPPGGSPRPRSKASARR